MEQPYWIFQKKISEGLSIRSENSTKMKFDYNIDLDSNHLKPVSTKKKTHTGIDFVTPPPCIMIEMT